MDGMRDPYPELGPEELTALRRIGGGLAKYAQLYHAYTLIALELVAFDPEGRLVATEAGRQWLRDADPEMDLNEGAWADPLLVSVGRDRPQHCARLSRAALRKIILSHRREGAKHSRLAAIHRR